MEPEDKRGRPLQMERIRASQCSGKVCFSSYSAAHNRGLRRITRRDEKGKKRRGSLNVYYCRFCGAFHVGGGGSY